MSPTIEQDQNRLSQKSFLTKILGALPTQELLTVYLSEDSDQTRRGVFCALVPRERVASSLTDASWDLHVGSGMPGTVESWEGDEKQIAYLRFGDDNGIEPLILRREFHGVRESYAEISEEFRTFHNLFHDIKTNRLLKFDDSGVEEVVAIIERHRVQIRLKEIRQFLAIREMQLALFFDVREFSLHKLADLGMPKNEDEVRAENSVYGLYFGENSATSDWSSFSRLLGKRFVLPVPKEKSGFYGYAVDDPEQFVEFIIGVDSDGDEVLRTSDEAQLGNNFGANPDAPHYLTPVFFRKSVLDKYYQQPGKFSVDPGSLGCCGLWMISIDNHRDDVVVAWLGDLGRDLPFGEQLHWRAHNIAPIGQMSETFFGQQILCRWVDSDQLEHVFKREYQNLASTSQASLGWHFLLPLMKDDEHFLQALRIPANDEQKGFDELILALTKVLVDSINEKQMNALIPSDEIASVKGSISRLEKAWQNCSVVGGATHIQFLRDLQDLRSSGAAHRKGSNYKKNVEKHGVEEQPLGKVFRGILQKGLEFLKFAQSNLEMLKKQPKDDSKPTE